MNYTPDYVGLNATLQPIQDEDVEININIGYAIFVPVLILVTTAMNIGTIAAFWKIPTLRDKPSELLILNLACSDLLTGLIVIPLASNLYITPNWWPAGEIGCAIWILSIDISVHGTLFALMTISLDRFLLVYLEYPKYIKNVTRKRVYTIVASGWIIALLTATLEMGLWEKAKDLDETAGEIDHTKYCLSPPRRVRTFSLCFFLILYFFPVMFVCGLSVAFLYQLRIRLRKFEGNASSSVGANGIKTAGIALSASSGSLVSENVSSSQPKDNSPHSAYSNGVAFGTNKIELNHSVSSGDLISTQAVSSNRKKGVMSYSVVRNRYIKPGVTLVGLVSAMAICMLPYSFYVIIIESGCEHCNNLKLLYGLILMQFCNACLDPFIYVLTRKRMRRFFCSWK